MSQAVATIRHPEYQIDLFDGRSERGRIPRRHEDRPELRPNASCGQAWHIGVISIEWRARVGSVEIGFCMDTKRPRQVVVSVDNREVGVNPLGLPGLIIHR